MAIFASMSLHSQTFCPAGATWYYNGNALGFSGYHKLTYVNDTVINSVSCKKIIDHLQGYGYTTIDADVDTFYCYEQNGVVRMYNNKFGKNQFDTLYNINASIGDTWQMPRADTACDSINVTVLNTGISTINGNSLKWLSVGYPPYGGGMLSDTIIEGFGFIKTFFYYPMICQAMDERVFNGLRCYSDSAFGNYSTGISTTCDYFYTSVLESEKNERILGVYPNPASDKLNVNLDLEQSETATIEIVNAMGKLQHFQILNGNNSVTEISIAGLSEGIYFYKVIVNNNDTFKLDKLIVVR
ncbi:MAG: T9SS type A sorting domain-containing protein [Bacteroidia bacterium]